MDTDEKNINTTNIKENKEIKIKKVVLIVVVLVAVILLGYFLIYKKQVNKNEEDQVITNEERMNVLEKLGAPFDKQSSTVLTEEEKLQYINSLSNKDTSLQNKTTKTEEEINSILNAPN